MVIWRFSILAFLERGLFDKLLVIKKKLIETQHILSEHECNPHVKLDVLSLKKAMDGVERTLSEYYKYDEDSYVSILKYDVLFVSVSVIFFLWCQFHLKCGTVFALS